MKDKNQIRNKISQYAISTLIIKKSNKELRICVNYRDLNALTIKNRNTLLLIRKILQQLCKIRYYNKFDIIVVFNEIRIRFNNKYKTIFIICYNLFEYVVISFELYNVSITFQFYINKTFNSYLNDFYIIYINNILIYNNVKKDYKNYINKILTKFYKIDFYLNINKYIFFVKQIKYLNLIIIIEKIQINFKKVKNILE